MLQSKLYIKTSKQVPSDADSPNAKFLSQGGFVAKEMAGVYTFLPLGLRVLRKIQNIIREEMDSVGGQEILMPALSSLDRWKATQRQGMDVLFHLKGANESDLVLNPTHEELVAPLMQQYIFSYKDLPAAVYQIQDKFRNEPRAKSGILRGREFNMKDLYSFHATQEDLDVYYETVKQAYQRIYDRMGLGEVTVVTYASGGDFSKYSHEFQALCDAGEDTVYLCEKCRVAVNKEIHHEQNVCPECGNEKLVEKKGIEVGNIFKLGTRFSEPLGFSYTDESNEKHPVIMASYGIGPSRVMGTIVELLHDAKGILWPSAVAPFQIHLVGLDLEDEAVRKRAELVYQVLEGQGHEVLYDDRRGLSAGEKLGDADLIGIPLRLVVSKRTGVQVEAKHRNEKEAKLLDLTSIDEYLA